MEEESSDLTDSSARDMEIESEPSEDENDWRKWRPGETKEEYESRVFKHREFIRVKKLMRFAFPRQRETHLYKKKLLKESE